jgi:hypothetical protein
MEMEFGMTAFAGFAAEQPLPSSSSLLVESTTAVDGHADAYAFAPAAGASVKARDAHFDPSRYAASSVAPSLLLTQLAPASPSTRSAQPATATATAAGKSPGSGLRWHGLKSMVGAKGSQSTAAASPFAGVRSTLAAAAGVPISAVPMPTLLTTPSKAAMTGAPAAAGIPSSSSIVRRLDGDFELTNRAALMQITPDRITSTAPGATASGSPSRIPRRLGSTVHSRKETPTSMLS